MKFNNGVRKKHIRRSAIKKRLILVAALFFTMFVGIGYAYVKRTLNINNNTKISSLSWDIHFENLNVTDGSIEPLTESTISQDKMSITSVLDFKNDGEFYEYTVDVVNNGTINAMIESVEGLTLTEEQAKYFDYSATYSDGLAIANNQFLKGKTKETIKVRIALKDGLTITDLPTNALDIKFTFKLNYVQANNSGVRVRIPLVVDRQNENEITVGDLVTLSSNNSEQFYVISSDQDTTKLLSKSCLTSDAIQGNEFELSYLSDTAYWEDKVGDELTYFGSYSGTPNYPYVFDNNSSVYNLVKRYKENLIDFSIGVTDVKLPSYEELQGLSSNILTIENKTYITGSVFDNYNYYIVNGAGMITTTLVSDKNTYAVRPVVIIPTTELR